MDGDDNGIVDNEHWWWVESEWRKIRAIEIQGPDNGSLIQIYAVPLSGATQNPRIGCEL